MAITIDEVQNRLESLGIKVMVPEGEEVAARQRGVRYTTSHYVNSEGDHSAVIHVNLSEGGEYLGMVAPAVYNVRECKFKGVVFAALMNFMYITKFVQFEYDPEDGEIRVSVDMPILDGTATARQLHRLLNALIELLDQIHPVITHAMATGRVDMELLERKPEEPAIPEEVAGLIAQLGGIEELRLLAEAKAGKPK